MKIRYKIKKQWVKWTNEYEVTVPRVEPYPQSRLSVERMPLKDSRSAIPNRLISSTSMPTTWSSGVLSLSALSLSDRPSSREAKSSAQSQSSMRRKSPHITSRDTPTLWVPTTSSKDGCSPMPSTSWTITWPSRVKSPPVVRTKLSSLPASTSELSSPTVPKRSTTKATVHLLMPLLPPQLCQTEFARPEVKPSEPDCHPKLPWVAISRRTSAALEDQSQEFSIMPERMVIILIHV